AALGYTFEIRDPNWSTDAGTKALTAAIAEKPDLLIIHNPDIQSYARLLKRAQDDGRLALALQELGDLLGGDVALQRRVVADVHGQEALVDVVASALVAGAAGHDEDLTGLAG